MNHEEAQARWHECVDEGRHDAQLDAHLAECEACRTYVREMNAVWRVLGIAQRETERIGFPTETPESSHAPRTLHGRMRRVGAWLRVAAAIAIITGAAYWLQVGRFDRTPSEKIVSTANTRRPVVATLGVTMRGASAARHVVVVDAASTEEVQVYWLYPSLTPTPARDGRQDDEPENFAG